MQVRYLVYFIGIFYKTWLGKEKITNENVKIVYLRQLYLHLIKRY